MPGSSDIPRFGTPAATTDPALDPLARPGTGSLPPSDPALAPSTPGLPDSRYGAPADPLDDRGALPADRGALPLDREGVIPSPNDRPSQPMDDGFEDDRRLAKMIYRNHLATFHLVYGEGTVHYHLAHQQPGPQPLPCVDGHCPIDTMPSQTPYFAVLRLRSTNDAHYLHFTPEHGDQFTLEWAVALRRSQDGGYAVYRRTNEGWARYGSFGRQIVR